MARWKTFNSAFLMSAVSAIVARVGPRRWSLDWIALMLRITLPVAANLSDTFAAVQAGGHWHLFATAAA